MERYVNIKSPFTGGRVKEVSTVERVEYRDDAFDVPLRYFVCEDTGQQFTNTEQDEEWYNNLHTQYKSRHQDSTPYLKQAQSEDSASCVAEVLV